MDKNENMQNNGITIRNFTSEDVDFVISGHLKLYEMEYGLNTEVWKSYVKEGVYDFLNQFNKDKDCMYILDCNGVPSGSAAIKHIDEETAQFRFFFLEPELRGLGAGHKLFDMAIDFCIEKEYKNVFLWTFSTLYAARHLYKSKGFKVAETHENSEWGTAIQEERWDLEL